MCSQLCLQADCLTRSWDLFIPLHSSFHHLPVWGEQAGSVCSLGPSRAEDAAPNMLAVSFSHLAHANKRSSLPRVPWVQLFSSLALRRHKHSCPHHLWDLSRFFFLFFSFEHFAKTQKSQLLLWVVIPFGLLLGESFIKPFHSLTDYFWNNEASPRGKKK